MNSLISLTSLLIGLTPVAVEKIPADMNGNPIDPFVASKENTIVLVFAGVDCPISNRYVPAINRLSKNYGSKNVSFWIVYPGSYFDKKDVVSHLKAIRSELPH